MKKFSLNYLKNTFLIISSLFILSAASRFFGLSVEAASLAYFLLTPALISALQE